MEKVNGFRLYRTNELTAGSPDELNVYTGSGEDAQWIQILKKRIYQEIYG